MERDSFPAAETVPEQRKLPVLAKSPEHAQHHKQEMCHGQLHWRQDYKMQQALQLIAQA